MPRRFSRIKQGAYYNEGLQNYIQYLNTLATRPRQIGTREPMEFQTVYVMPFGADLGGTTERVEGRAQAEHITTLAPHINFAGTGCEVLTTATLGANTVVPFGKFRPARVIWQNATSRAVRVETSQITGLQYLAYDNVDRYSCAFGRKAVDDTIYDSFNALKVRLKGQPGVINRVSLQEENIDYTA